MKHSFQPKNKPVSQKGYSLIEVMVVGAIVAALGMIGAQEYKGYKAKARRAQAYNLLNTYYSTAHAARGEFGFFPGNFVSTGFSPIGKIGYRLRVDQNRNAPITLVDPVCISTRRVCNCAGACPEFKKWSEPPPGILGSRIGPVVVNNGACGGLAPRHVSDTTFVAATGAVINVNATSLDRINMNERKQIAFCSQGLR